MMTNTPLIPSSPSPVYMTLDLFELLNACETLSDELMKCTNPAGQQALYGHLAGYLAAMEAELEKPLPHYLIERLTVEKLADTQPQQLAGDSELLRQYCYALARALSGQKLALQVHSTLNSLLFELVNLLIEDLLTPRFEKVANN